MAIAWAIKRGWCHLLGLVILLMEQAGKPRPSPFVLVFGSFDAFDESIHAGYVTGAYD